MSSGVQPRRARALVWALACIAGLILTWSRLRGQVEPWVLLTRIFADIGCAAAIGYYFRGRDGKKNIPTNALLAIAGMLALPWVSQWVSLAWVTFGEPLELRAMASMQNAALALAALSQWKKFERYSVLTSFFLALFTIGMVDTSHSSFVHSDNGLWPYSLGCLYVILGIYWLMTNYWEQLEAHLPSETRRDIPVRGSAILLTLAVLAITVVLAVPVMRHQSMAIAGFMPTSGGRSDYDKFARGGVRDGDMLIGALDNAATFGPVESELFMDSKMPSLYDAFNDAYNEPARKKKRSQDKAVAVDSDKTRDDHQRKAKSKHSSREFSTVRKSGKSKRAELTDKDSTALLYVVGEVPLHLAVEKFDTFDGVEWTHSKQPRAKRKEREIKLKRVDEHPWITWNHDCVYPLFEGKQVHSLKFINLKTDRIPSSPQLAAVHIDRIDRPDFFAWGEDDQLLMTAREFVPQLTVVHIVSRQTNLTPLRHAGDFSKPFQAKPDRFLHVPPKYEQLKSTMEAWVVDVPRGWLQIEAVTERLRTDFLHDPSVRASAESDDVISFFLEEKRGPDYMFASTAAMGLRSLGYPTRIVGGFYTSRYDRASRQTIVGTEDAHFWLEVRVDSDTWIPVEPTPGFEPPRTVLSLSQQIWKTATQLIAWCLDSWVLISLALVGLAVCFWCRYYLFTASTYLLWHIQIASSSRQRVLWTLKLLTWRGSWAGCKRKSNQTVSTWFRDVSGAGTGRFAETDMLLSLADRALYSTRRLSAEDHVVRQVCHHAIWTWTVNRIRGAQNRETA